MVCPYIEYRVKSPRFEKIPKSIVGTGGLVLIYCVFVIAIETFTAFGSDKLGA